MAKPRALLSRPLDILYIFYFLIHIFAAIFIDLQALYNPSFLPQFMRDIIKWYLEAYNDPIIRGAMGEFVPFPKRELGIPHAWMWIRVFFWCEVFVQLPFLFAGVYHLVRDNPNIYPLVLIYASHAATTTLPVLATIYAVPTAPEGVAAYRLSPAQRNFHLANYTPFLVVPVIMALDMSLRLGSYVRCAIKAQEKEVQGKEGKRVGKKN